MRLVVETGTRADAHVMPAPPKDRLAAIVAGHRPDFTCWCFPAVQTEDPVTGRRVYLHKRES